MNFIQIRRILFVILLSFSFVGCKFNLEPIVSDQTAQYFYLDSLNEALDEAKDMDDIYCLLIAKNNRLLISQ